MANDLNLMKAEAVSAFLETKPDRYLAMVANVERRLKLSLGEEKVTTALAEEVMSEVISDAIDDTRKWDMNKYSAEQALWYNIRSELSTLVKKEARYVLVNASAEGEEEMNGNGIENVATTPAEDIEGNIDAENLENYCLNVILKDDEDAQIVLNEMLKGMKQKQIAEDLGISIEEAEAIIRKIKRKISKQIPYHMIKNLPKNLRNKILNQT